MLDARRRALDTSAIPDFFIDPLVLLLTEAPPNITTPRYFTRSSSKRHREDNIEVNKRLTKIARAMITQVLDEESDLESTYSRILEYAFPAKEVNGIKIPSNRKEAMKSE
jgi:hypothetical protein